MTSQLETPYLQSLGYYRLLFSDIPVIATQIDMIVSVCTDLQHKRLPQHAIVPLGLDDTTYILALAQLTQGQRQATAFKTAEKQVQRLDHLLRNFRDFVAQHFGIWALFTKAFLKRWQKLFPKQLYLEIMAGNGLLSAGLRQFGQQCMATDDLSWAQSSQTAGDLWTQVRHLDALSAIDQYGAYADALVMVWSQDQNPIDVAVLNHYRQHMAGKAFFVVGEKYGATNSPQFWDQARYMDSRSLKWLNQLYPRFDLIHDQVYLIQ